MPRRIRGVNVGISPKATDEGVSSYGALEESQ